MIFPLLVIFVSFNAVLPSCLFPPEFWCSSAEIAAECGVTKQCSKWLKTPAPAVLVGDDDDDKTNDKNDVKADEAKNNKKSKLEMVLLYEALCPDCQEFIINQLAPTISELGPEFWSHVHLVLYPYGNADETYDPKSDRWMFRCQHGPEECLGNQIATCSMNLSGNEARTWFPFVHCMELQSRGRRSRGGRGRGEGGRGGGDDMVRISARDASIADMIADGKQCASEAKLNWTAINECVGDWRGNLVQHAVAKATPKHDYVPWVIFNGRHTEKLQEAAEKDLFKLVCQFLHHPKPFACYKRSVNLSAARCYAKSPFKNT